MNSRTHSTLMFGATGLLLFFVLLWPAPAATLEEAKPESQTARASIWKNGVGRGFTKNVTDAGFALGAGFGVRMLGSEVAHDLGLGLAHFGWILSDVVADNKWYRGNWELLGEFFGGAQFQPNHRYLFGLLPLLRYNFVTGNRFIPFVDVGAGFSYTNIRRPDLSTRFQFNVQVGTGMHYFVREAAALTLRYCWFHLSNADIEEPNGGLNTQMFMLGVSWFF